VRRWCAPLKVDGESAGGGGGGGRPAGGGGRGGGPPGGGGGRCWIDELGRRCGAGFIRRTAAWRLNEHVRFVAIGRGFAHLPQSRDPPPVPASRALATVWPFQGLADGVAAATVALTATASQRPRRRARGVGEEYLTARQEARQPVAVVRSLAVPATIPPLLPPIGRVRGGAADLGIAEEVRLTSRQPAAGRGGRQRRSALTNQRHTTRGKDGERGGEAVRSRLPPARVPAAVLLTAMEGQHPSAAAAVGPRCGPYGSPWRLPWPARGSLRRPTAGGGPVGIGRRDRGGDSACDGVENGSGGIARHCGGAPTWAVTS